MKRVVSLLAAVITLSLILNAQTKMIVWKEGKKTQFLINTVDSVTFETISTHGIGTFSVSNTNQVTFSSGNLQYHPMKDEWHFAANQTDCIGEQNSNISANYDGWLDLFGWSGNTASFGVSASTNEDEYSGTFVDWGCNVIDNDKNNTWRTLTEMEWRYILYNRKDADKLIGIAQVMECNGLVLLPDNWNCPEGIIFKSGFNNNALDDAFGEYQSFTSTQWIALEQSGAVFLPVAGFRVGRELYYIQEYGSYWTATDNGEFGITTIDIFADELRIGGTVRSDGLSVRLVQDL